MEVLKKIYHYRYFVYNSVKSDFATRFANNALGSLWAVINPLIQVLIYAIILSSVLSSKLPGIDNRYSYAIYLMSGMLCWTLFNEIVLTCLGVFVGNANIIKKMDFPKVLLPINIVFIALINNILLFLSIVVVFLCLGHSLGVSLLILPFYTLIVILMAVGIGVFCGIINVFMRDMSNFVNIIMQFLFWLTPIVYMIKILPENISNLIYLNPLVGIVQGYHDILIFNKVPDFSLMIYPCILACIAVFLAFFIYKRASKDMADVL